MGLFDFFKKRKNNRKAVRMEFNGYFENHFFGNKEADVAFLNGILSAFAYFNHKVDTGFCFYLKTFLSKEETFQKYLKRTFGEQSTYQDVSSKEVENLFYNWLFCFSEVDGVKYGRNAFLNDKFESFSHSDYSTRIEFVEEYIYFLIKTISPINIYRIKPQRRFDNDADIICFHANEKFYILSLSWYD